MDENCLGTPPYAGRLVNSAYGNVKAPQNIDEGYVENVCLQCENAHDSKVNFANWRIEQLGNCEISLTSLEPPEEEVSYDLFYFQEDIKVNNTRYEYVDINPLFERFKSNAAHCPTTEWELYYNDGVTPLKPDEDFHLLRGHGGVILKLGVSTEKFNQSYQLILKNKRTYGPTQQQ